MGSRKAQALKALGEALAAANAAGDVELAGALSTATYWAASAENPYLP